MPTYCYQCNGCGKMFEVKHKMSEQVEKCLHCESADIFKVPVFEYTNAGKEAHKSSQPGKIVDKYISDTKKEIEKDKKILKSKEL